MPYCPDCGAPFEDGDAFCSECGTSLEGVGGPPGEDPAGRRSRSGDRSPNRSSRGDRSPRDGSRRGSRRRGPESGRRGSDRTDRRGRAGSDQTAGRAPGTGSASPTEDGGSGRRDLLKVGGGLVGVAALAGGGWFAYQELIAGGSTPDTPKGVVRQFYRRIKNGNREGANALIHPDSPRDDVTQEQIRDTQEAEFTITNLEVVERSDDTAAVRVEYELQVNGETVSSSSTVRVRKYQGSWRMWR